MKSIAFYMFLLMSNMAFSQTIGQYQKLSPQARADIQQQVAVEIVTKDAVGPSFKNCVQLYGIPNFFGMVDEASMLRNLHQDQPAVNLIWLLEIAKCGTDRSPAANEGSNTNPIHHSDSLESRSKQLFQAMEDRIGSRADQYKDQGESGEIVKQMIANWSHPKTKTDWDYLKKLDAAAAAPDQDCGADGGACQWEDPFTESEKQLRASGMTPPKGEFPYLNLKRQQAY